jgi:small Trp-rich protein
MMAASVDIRWPPHPKAPTMFFVIIGVLIIITNLADIGPFAAWTWNITGDLWKFCVPFVFALLWWIWADKSGLDKRREIEKMEERKQNRRKENLVSLGLDTRARRKGLKK